MQANNTPKNIEEEIKELANQIQLAWDNAKDIQKKTVQRKDKKSAADDFAILNYFLKKINLLKGYNPYSFHNDPGTKPTQENLLKISEAFNEYNRINLLLQELQSKVSAGENHEIATKIQNFYAQCRMAIIWDQLDLTKLKDICEKLNIKELTAMLEKVNNQNEKEQKLKSTQTFFAESKVGEFQDIDLLNTASTRQRSKAVVISPLSTLPIKTRRLPGEAMEWRTSEVDVVERIEDYRNFVSTWEECAVTPQFYNKRLMEVTKSPALYNASLIETSNIIHALERDPDEPYKCTDLFKQHIKNWLLTDRETLKDAFQTKETKNEKGHIALSDFLIIDLLCHCDCLLKLDLSTEEKEKLLLILINKPQLFGRIQTQCYSNDYTRLDFENSLNELFKEHKRFNELQVKLNKMFEQDWPERNQKYLEFKAEQLERKAQQNRP